MVSRFVARSGIAVCLVSEVIGWQPDYIYQVGVGMSPQEIDVFLDTWPEVHIDGFEAHPEIYKAIKPNYRGNLNNLALGNQEGTVDLFVPPRHKDGSSVYALAQEGCKQLTVPMSTLDAQYPKGPASMHSLLWLDCEGSELAVLQGGEDFLKNIEVVNVELTMSPQSDAWCSPVDVHRFLLDHGFVLQWIHTQRISAGQNDGIYVRPYIFKPQFCSCFCAVENKTCNVKSCT